MSVTSIIKKYKEEILNQYHKIRNKEIDEIQKYFLTKRRRQRLIAQLILNLITVIYFLIANVILSDER